MRRLGGRRRFEVACELATLRRGFGCGRCTEVCPHRVFEMVERKARLVEAERCMECGACQVNCPAQAIEVESGVGCAHAMINAALRGKKEVTCGDDCCGN